VHTSFGDWYRLIELEPRGDVLEARWKGVVSAVKDADQSKVMEFVRIALARPPSSQEFVTSFREEFRSVDAAFTMSGNSLELNVLAGAAWAQVLERADSVSDLAALAMQAASFQASSVEKLQAQFRVLARDYLSTRGTEIRRQEPWSTPRVGKPRVEQVVEPYVQALRSNQFPTAATAFPEVINKLEEWINETALHFESALAVQEEQSEIAWWILGEYSRELDVHLSQISVAEACLTLAKELADLTRLSPGPVARRAFLDRMLRHTKQKQTTKLGIDEVINAAKRAQREIWIKDLRATDFEDLVPLHFGVLKSLETEGAAEWLPAFRKGTGLASKAGWSALDLSDQFYTERLVIRAATEDRE